MRFKAISIAMVLVLVVVAAGCGSKKSATKTTNSGTTTTTTSGAGGSGGGGTTTTTGSTGNGSTPSFASAKNCAQLASIGAKFSEAMAATSGTGKTNLSDVADVFTALAKAAPSEIRPDFEIIAAAFGKYADALNKSGYKPGQVPTAAQIAALQSLAKTFSDPKLKAAEQHLSAWGSKNCGGLTSTTG
jgi:hypothetical protein